MGYFRQSIAGQLALDAFDILTVFATHHLQMSNILLVHRELTYRRIDATIDKSLYRDALKNLIYEHKPLGLKALITVHRNIRDSPSKIKKF